MFAGEVAQAAMFDAQLVALKCKVRMAWQGGEGHGVRMGEAVPVVAGAEAGGAGMTVCGKVTLAAAASPVGRNSGPCCPHAASVATTPTARTSLIGDTLTRIW
jgi:hypothetical protein